MIGSTLGRYRIIEQLGTGGMAVVYKGYDPFMDRMVAIKTVAPQIVNQPDFVERFRREAKLLAALTHPNILAIFDYAEESGNCYLVTQLVEGDSLADRIRNGLLPLLDTSRILTQIASALDFAHNQNIFHRDIKPSNILLDQHDRVFVTDFGIARMMEGLFVQTFGVMLGTPQYMSPEQCQGKPVVTVVSDIYSLGIVLFEMLTGALPFQAETPMAVLLKQINEPLPSLRSKGRDLPLSIERVIFKAMAKEPEHRYQSAGAMAEALAQAVREYDETPLRQPDDKGGPLFNILQAHFDVEEFRTLCFELGVNYDNLRGEGLAPKMRELIAYCQRRNQVEKLITMIKQERPSIDMDG